MGVGDVVGGFVAGAGETGVSVFMLVAGMGLGGRNWLPDIFEFSGCGVVDYEGFEGVWLMFRGSSLYGDREEGEATLQCAETDEMRRE